MATTSGVTELPDQPLPSVVVELGRLVERRMHRALGDHGVNAGQFLALVRIARYPGISRAGLARGLQVTPQAVGGLTSQLLDKGLVARAVSSPGLPVSFTLTAAGQEVLRGALPAVDDITHDMMRFFRPNLASAIDGGLRHLLTRLG